MISYPNCAHGKVVGLNSFLNIYKFGTGCLIGPDIVLTAVHVIYNLSKGLELSELSFIPVYLAQIPTFTGFKVKKAYYPE